MATAQVGTPNRRVKIARSYFAALGLQAGLAVSQWKHQFPTQVTPITSFNFPVFGSGLPILNGALSQID